MTIWVLLSIYNEYSQPEANLEAWWPARPRVQDIAEILELDVKSNPNKYNVESIFDGHETRINDCDYRLEEISIGKYERKL